MAGVREDLILDITSAQRSIDLLEAQVASAFAGIGVTVDTAGISQEISAAAAAADTNVAVTADTTGLASEISAAADVAPTEVRVEADTSAARAEVNKLDRDLDSAKDSANGLRQLLTGAALLAGARGLFSLAEASSAVNEQITGSEVVFGNFANSVQTFAAGAERIGLADAQALQLSNTFGQLALSAGLADQQIVDFATTIVERGADIASLRDIDLTQTLDALRSGLVGETEPLRNIGIFMNEALVQSTAYKLGLADLGEELTDAQKIQARYQIILEQSEIAAGNFALTSEGLANTQRQVAAEMQDLAARSGRSLEPTFLNLAQFARDDLLPTLGQLADQALPAIGQILEDLAPVLGITLDLLVAATPLLQITADVIGAIPPPLLAVVGGYIALNKAQRLINWASETRSIKGVTSAVDGLRSGFSRLDRIPREWATLGIAAGAIGSIIAVAQAGGGDELGSLAGGLISFGDSLTGFQGRRTERVSEEIKSIIGALDTNTASGALAAVDKLTTAYGELDDVRRVTLGNTRIVAPFDSAEESARFDQIQEQIVALNQQARAEVEAGIESGRFTDKQIAATKAQTDREKPASAIIRQLQLLEDLEARAARQAELTIDKYDDVARSYVGVADALGRLRTAAPEVESAISRIRLSGDTSEDSFLNLALAIDAADLSADSMKDAAAGLGVSTEALGGFVETLTSNLDDFISTAVDGLPTVSDAFDRALDDASTAAEKTATAVRDSADQQAQAVIDAADARAEAAGQSLDSAGADKIRQAAEERAEAIRAAGDEEAQAIEDSARVTARGLTDSLRAQTQELDDWHSDLEAITAAGFGDIAGLLAQEGQEAGDAVADELAAALESGNTALLEGLRGANDAFRDESRATVDFITNELAPEFLSATGLLASAITESFGEGLDFEEKIRIAAELARAELDPQAEAIAAVAATKGEAAARAYGEALKLDQETIDAGVKAGNAIAGIDTASFSTSGRRIGTEIGNSIVDGFTAALKQRETEVSDKAAQLVLAAENAARRAGEIESPSKVWARLGGFMGEGLAIGLSSTIPAIATTGARTVASAVPAFGMRNIGPGSAAAAPGIDYEQLGRTIAAALPEGGHTFNLHGIRSPQHAAKEIFTEMRAKRRPM